MSDSCECHICSNEYLEKEYIVPLILDGCGHTICQVCAIELSKAAPKQSAIICPFCFKQTAVCNGDVQCLKKNFAIIQIADSIKKQRIGKKMKRIRKEGNQESGQCAENPSHPASLYCAECRLDFCEDCWMRVHRLKSFNWHKRSHLADKPPMCPIHTQDLVDFVCKKSDCPEKSRLLCSSCVGDGKHIGHVVQKIPDALLEYRRHCEKNLLLIEENEVKLAENIATIKRITETYKTEHNEFQEKVQQIDNHFKQIAESLALERVKAFSTLLTAAQKRFGLLETIEAAEKAKLRTKKEEKIKTYNMMTQDITEILNLPDNFDDKKFSKVDDVSCPSLPLSMSSVQVYLPPLPTFSVKIEPTYQLIGGTFGVPKNPRIFSEFLEKAGTPTYLQQTTRFNYKGRVLDLVNSMEDHGEQLRSMIYAEVAPDSVSKLVDTIMNHVNELLQNRNVERIVVGVMAFEGVQKAMEDLEMSIGNLNLRLIIIHDRKTAIEKIVDASIDV